MSYKVNHWAQALAINPNEKLVLMALARHVNKDIGDCIAWPSRFTMYQFASLSPRTITRCLASLEKRGLIRDTKQRKGYHGGVKVYQIIGYLEYIGGSPNWLVSETGQDDQPDALTLDNVTSLRLDKLASRIGNGYNSVSTKNSVIANGLHPLAEKRTSFDDLLGGKAQ